MTYGWHTSIYEWQTDDIRVTYGWHTSTYEWHRNDIQVTFEYKRSCFFGGGFYVRNCSFCMGIIFCSNVALVWTSNTRSVYNFITKESNIPVNLVQFFNDVSFLFCRFLVWSNKWAKKSFIPNRAKICCS